MLSKLSISSSISHGSMKSKLLLITVRLLLLLSLNFAFLMKFGSLEVLPVGDIEVVSLFVRVRRRSIKILDRNMNFCHKMEVADEMLLLFFLRM